MNTLIESCPTPDRTLSALLFDATATGDWSYVEHFMLGNPTNAMPMDDQYTV